MIAEVVAASKENPYLVEAIKKATKATDTAEDGDGITDTAEDALIGKGPEAVNPETDSGKVGDSSDSEFGSVSSNI